MTTATRTGMDVATNPGDSRRTVTETCGEPVYPRRVGTSSNLRARSKARRKTAVPWPASDR